MSDPRSITVKNLSGSRVAAVLGQHKYLSPAQLAAEIIESRNPGFCIKNKIELPELEINKSIDFGWDFENFIRDIFEYKNDCKIVDVQRIYEIGNRTCHIDGRIEDTKRILEIKTASASAYYAGWNEKTGEVLKHYYIQAQHNIDMTDSDECVIAVLIFPRHPEEICKNLDGEDAGSWKSKIKRREITEALYQMGYYHEYLIERDQELIDVMRAACEIFWNDYIIPEIIPPASFADDFKIVCPEPHWETVADLQIEQICEEYSKTKSEIKTLEKRIDQLRTIIFNYMFFTKDRNEIGERTMRLFSRTGKQIASWTGKTFTVRGFKND